MLRIYIFPDLQDPGIIRVLLDGGADIDAKDNDGVTAMMIAMNNKRPEILQALIAAGADINAENKSGL